MARVRQSQLARMTPEKRAGYVEGRWEDCGVPGRLLDCSFETFNPDTKPGLHVDAFTACRDLVDHGTVDGKNGILLIGPPGNGKSSLACCVLRGILEREAGQCQVRFWNVPSGIIAIQSAFGKDNQADVIGTLKQQACLVLDDLGKHKWTEWVQEQMYVLLNHFWEQERPLVITSNIPEKTFLGLDDALTSRILGSCHMVSVLGEDRRA